MIKKSSTINSLFVKYELPSCSAPEAEASSLNFAIHGIDVASDSVRASFGASAKCGNNDHNIHISSDSDDESTEVTVRVYRMGKAKHIWREKTNFGYFGANICLDDLIPLLTPGRYFATFEGIGLSKIKGAIPVDNFYIVNFTIIPNPEDMKPIKITSANISSDLEIELTLDGKAGPERLWAFCLYDAVSFTACGTARAINDNASELVLADINEDAYSCNFFSSIDSDYVLLAACNSRPYAAIEMQRRNGEWRLKDIEYYAENAKWRQLADATFFMTGFNRDFMKLAANPGLKPLKAYALDEFRWKAINRRRQAAFLPRIDRRMYLSVCAEPTPYYLSVVEDMMDCTVHPNPSKILCSPIAARRIAGMNNDICIPDFSESSLIIADFDSLAQPQMADAMQAFCHELSSSAHKGVAVIGSKMEVNAAFDAMPEAARLFSDSISIEPLNPTDALRHILHALTVDSMIVDGKAMHKILDGLIKRAQACPSSLTPEWCMEFIEKGIYTKYRERMLCDRIANIDIIEAEDIDEQALVPTDNNASCLAQLNALVGLDCLKAKIGTMLDRIKFDSLRHAAGLSAPANATYHCIFTGNPGTGKTTIARMMARIWHHLGIISKGEAIIADRSNIVGRYIGETEANMRRILNSARGNVLFIDEAYTLCSDSENKRDFGHKAIECLLTALAQPDPDMVVILAGYDTEMRALLETNPGLSSRFPIQMHFPDYTASQLCEIAVNMLARQNYTLEPDALNILHECATLALAQKDRNFGNARWAEQFVAHGIIPAVASRVIASIPRPSAHDLTAVLAEDVRHGAKSIRSDKALSPRPTLGFIPAVA